jgi:hypothetical protein
MAKLRTSIPTQTADGLLHANQHTCCRCREARQPIEIHHINGDPSDHRPTNLAVLCRNCHGLVSQSGPLGRRISPGEVQRLKQEWERACARGEVADEPAAESHDVVSIRSEEAREWTYRLSPAHVIVASFSSDVALTAVIGRKSDVRRWCNDEVAIVAAAEDIYTSQLRYTTDRDNHYVVRLENNEDDDAIVEVDIAIWSGERD